MYQSRSREAVVHLNFQAGLTFPVPVCTVPSSMNRTSWCNKVDAVRIYALYRLNSILLKKQRCVYHLSSFFLLIFKLFFGFLESNFRVGFFILPNQVHNIHEERYKSSSDLCTA